jgi:AcrR family transcriptional regulator
MELVDEEGPTSLTMRRLANELGTGPATLYGYFDSRDALLAELVDESLAGFELPDPPPADWHEAALATGRRFRATLLAHPNLLPLLPVGQLAGPNSLRSLEAAIAGMAGYGFTTDAAARAVMLATHYVMGFCIQEAGGQIPSGGDRDDYHRLLAGLPAGVYPLLVAGAPALADTSADEEFDLGLELLVGRLEPPSAPVGDG